MMGEPALTGEGARRGERGSSWTGSATSEPPSALDANGCLVNDNRKSAKC